jgi:hypothetical protein
MTTKAYTPFISPVSILFAGLMVMVLLLANALRVAWENERALANQINELRAGQNQTQPETKP